MILPLQVGRDHPRARPSCATWSSIYYDRNDLDFKRGTFRVRGDTLEIFPAYTETAYPHRILGRRGRDASSRSIRSPARCSRAPDRDQDLPGEALRDLGGAHQGGHRSTSRPSSSSAWPSSTPRTSCWRRSAWSSARKYDLEMIREIGYCTGIENYSRHLDQRKPGEPPWTLIDYFPSDFLMVIDESHMTMPQVRGMYNGDRSRKEHAGRLRVPAALGARQPPARCSTSSRNASTR